MLSLRSRLLNCSISIIVATWAGILTGATTTRFEQSLSLHKQRAWLNTLRSPNHQGLAKSIVG